MPGTFRRLSAGVRARSKPWVRRIFPWDCFPKRNIESARVKLQPGEFLVIYTDGVSEAVNTRNELFEESRLRQIVEAFQGQTVEETGRCDSRRREGFTEGAAQSDDITLLVVQYKG